MMKKYFENLKNVFKLVKRLKQCEVKSMAFYRIKLFRKSITSLQVYVKS